MPCCILLRFFFRIGYASFACQRTKTCPCTVEGETEDVEPAPRLHWSSMRLLDTGWIVNSSEDRALETSIGAVAMV